MGRETKNEMRTNLTSFRTINHKMWDYYCHLSIDIWESCWRFCCYWYSCWSSCLMPALLMIPVKIMHLCSSFIVTKHWWAPCWTSHGLHLCTFVKKHNLVFTCCYPSTPCPSSTFVHHHLWPPYNFIFIPS